MMPYDLFERCNETELYQIARASGLVVTPSATKDELIKYITGEELPPPIAHDIDEWRLAIMGFVIEHRITLQVQLRCPAKTMDPRACFQCVDQQVVSCLAENKNNLHLITLHKKAIEYPKPEGDTMTTATVLNPQNAPRDKAKLTAAGSFQLRRLAESLGMLASAETQLAYGKLGPEERAENILKVLVDLDAKGGGAPTNGAAPATTAAPASAPTADAPGSSVAAVDPTAFKNAQDATAPGPGVAGTGKRQPKTNGSGEDNLATALVAIQSLVQAGNSSVTQALTELRGAVQGAAIIAKLEAIEKAVQEQTAVMKYTLMLVLTIAEERGVASRFDLLADAVSEAANYDAMLHEVRKSNPAGKAA